MRIHRHVVMSDILEVDHGEGYIETDTGELYYRRFGSGDEAILTLHGGPGMPHNYLLPLAEHGGEDFTVYMYDQFGVGESDKPAPGDFDQYTVEHYREEVDAVRTEIGADTVHLYGQSWGGMLALEYVLECPEHVESLILANTLASVQSAYESMKSVLDDLSADNQETIETAHERRAFDDPEYEAALHPAYAKHVCRVDPFPDPVERTLDNVNTDIYGLMWGPNEFVLLEHARLRGWDVRDRLDEISTPTLVMTGSYDEISPDVAKEISEGIPDACLIELQESSHMPFWEQPDEHFEAIDAFVRENADLDSQYEQ